MITFPEGCTPELERKMSDFGLPYKGWYFDMDGVRYVGLIVVRECDRGKGYFKLILDTLKKNMRMVVLFSPTALTRIAALKEGYKYDAVAHALIWERVKLGVRTDVDEVFR